MNESARRARGAAIRSQLGRLICPEPVDGVVRVGHGTAFGWTFRLPARDDEAVDQTDRTSSPSTHDETEEVIS